MSQIAPYSRQDRGGAGDYDRYLAGMDASMRQKVALTAAHLLARGRVADMGMGSGAGSHALACLYPGLEVVGVDVNPEMVERARERYPLPNLQFLAGDVAAPCFPEGSLDGIFDSSVLHHVTSFSGYDPSAATRALGVQARQLREGGVLIVRDFLSPGEDEVVVELPEDHGHDPEDPRDCSSASLFRRFSREFRPQSPSPGFPLRELPLAADGWVRFAVTRRLAAEFLLRKDYRADWEVELLEEYTYLSQGEGPSGPGRLARATTLDGSLPVGYVTEPLSVLLQDRPLGQTVELALQQRAGLSPLSLRAFRLGGHYFPSPGGTVEEVRSLLVEVDPVDVSLPLAPVSGFSTSGRVAAVEAGQVLRVAQVGGLPDARLEMNVYDLLEELGMPPGSWIASELALVGVAEPLLQESLEGLLLGSPRRAWDAAPGEDAGFLDLCCGEFEELSAEGEVLHRKRLEYVKPRRHSLDTVACAVLALQDGEVLLGLDDDDLPAAQAFGGQSNLLVAPAWRLPPDLQTLTPAREWVLGRLARQHGVEAGSVRDLGGRYHPSPGVSPEAVYPLAVEVRRVSPGRGRPLHWVPLREVIARMDALQDGHLRVVARRAAHALEAGQERPR